MSTMSCKRGPEDINTSGGSEASGETSPKRSKLDFLAMIAEMSEKTEVSPPVVSANSTVATNSTEKTELTTNDASKKNDETTKTENLPPVKKSAPKSSFAAWKLAKSRKKAFNSPNRKDAPLKAKKALELPENPTSARKELLMKEADEPAAQPAPDLADFKAAATDAASSKDKKLKKLKKKKIAEDIQAMKKEVAAAVAVHPSNEPPSLGVPKVASLPPKKAGLKLTAAAGGEAKKNPPPAKAGVSLMKKDKDGSKKLAKKSGKKNKKKKDKEKAATFPEKIMELLLAGLATKAIYWLPEGEAIAVDPKYFTESPVISKQFRGNKLSSFVRSLNRWGFRRIFYHSLPDKTLAFYHRLFQKTAPELVKEMKMDSGEKEPELPPGMAAIIEDTKLPGEEASPVGPTAGAPPPAPTAAQAPPQLPPAPASGIAALADLAAAASAVAVEAPNSPAVSAATAGSGVPQQPGLVAPAQAPQAAPAPPQVQDAPAAAVDPNFAANAAAIASLLERSGVDLSSLEGQRLLQQAMVAEQDRSGQAMQQLQAQQMLLQSLTEQQNAAHAEELLMQSMLSGQHRPELSIHQRQAEQALLQQMLVEEQTAALAAALGQGGANSLNAGALLREQLLAQQLGLAAAPGAPAGGQDILALLQQQLQGQQPAPAAEPSYMEQLLLLEQQQQQQRQQEAAILAAHGFSFS